MKKILLTGAALALASTSAHAQLLGGGLGGSVGGAVGGAIGGAGSLDMPATTIRNTTRGTLDGAARTSGSQSVDRKSGRVKADRRAQAQGSGSLDQAVSGPLGALSGSGSANAQGSGSANAHAQLVGTDAIVSTAGYATGTARGVARQAQQAAGSAVTAVGSATGSAGGSAGAMASGAFGHLALAGSAAAAGSGMASVAPGMQVVDSDGETIGQVRQIVASSRGQVHQVLVSTDKGDAMLPASNFAAEGNLLLSAMSEGRVEKTAKNQAKEQPPQR